MGAVNPLRLASVDQIGVVVDARPALNR